MYGTKNIVYRYSAYIVLVALLSLISVGCAKKPPSEERTIRIDDYSLSRGEFDELFTELDVPEDTPEVRETFLENLIIRKVLLQEAQREGLDREKDFLKSVENFWEQALLKIVIDKKIKEISTTISVTDQEIQDYYNQWIQENPESPKTLDEVCDIIKWQLLRKKQEEAFNSWIEKLKDATSIKIDKKALGLE